MQVEFIVSMHAYERLKERMGCKEKKAYKIARKAWYHPQTPDNKLIVNRMAKGKRFHEYRLYNGCIFVFDINNGIKFLVTVLPYS